MAQTNLIESDIATTCDRCGDECSEGFEERVLFTEPDTGYKDVEIVCADCSQAERTEPDENACEACQHQDGTHEEHGRWICDDCVDEPEDYSGGE